VAGRQAEREGVTGSTLHLPILTARLELNIVVRAPIYRLPAARLRRRAIKILTHLWIDCCLGAHSHSHLCRVSADGVLMELHTLVFLHSLSASICSSRRRAKSKCVRDTNKTKNVKRRACFFLGRRRPCRRWGCWGERYFYFCHPIRAALLVDMQNFSFIFHLTSLGSTLQIANS
jgi:hypothetical protein